ncbi:MAG: nucleotidyltransferase family protein [Clostridia bacterium]|nr:nucleotidyltransferase family protein [Clostridia bacterium]
MDKKTLLFALLRFAVFGTGDAEALRSALTVPRLQGLYALAKRHDLAHLLAHAVHELGFVGEDPIFAALERELLLAIYRVEQLRFTLDEIALTLAEAKIPYMPLKGSVLRAAYPEPWMRTSCDVDVLVREEQLSAAIEALQAKGYTVDDHEIYHDVSMHSPTGMHLELHFHLGLLMPVIDAVLAPVWDYAVCDEGYRYRMTDEFFYFHQIAHAARHFKIGGCGIRPFLDIYLLSHEKGVREGATLHDLLARSELVSFYENAVALSEAWFGEGTHTEITQAMERFLLDGGVYGTEKNRISVDQAKTGGRFAYAMQRIFMPLRLLKKKYPVLNKYPILYPFCQIHRFFRILFTRRAGAAVTELKQNATIKEETGRERLELFHTLGIE